MSERTSHTNSLGLLLVTVVVVTLSACGGSGVGVQTGSVTPTTSSRSSLPSASNPPSPSDTATITTGFGDAQPAVDALVKVQAEYSAIARDPAKNSTSTLDLLLAGQARAAFDTAFASAKSAGVLYRGTPPAARISVTSDQTTASVPQVVLANCPLQSDTDPFLAYDGLTGNSVPVPTSSVGPPFGQTATVFKVNGNWVVTQFSTDATTTCSA